MKHPRARVICGRLGAVPPTPRDASCAPGPRLAQWRSPSAQRTSEHRSAAIRTDRRALEPEKRRRGRVERNGTARRSGGRVTLLSSHRPFETTLFHAPPDAPGDRVLGRIRARHAVGRADHVQRTIDLAGGFAPTCRPFARRPTPDARRPTPRAWPSGHAPFSRGHSRRRIALWRSIEARDHVLPRPS